MDSKAQKLTNGTINGVHTPSQEPPAMGHEYRGRPSRDARKKALSLIKDALPKMEPLKAVLKIDLNLDDGPIYLDARGRRPELKCICDGEPDCSVKIKPEYIEQFVDGRLEPRYGLFKDGFFDPTTLPTGNIRVAVKFADYLCPVTRVDLPRVTDTSKLPQPTEDIDQVLADVRQWGYGLVANALSPAEITKLSSALRQQAKGEVDAGVAKNDGGAHGPNQRIWTLINKGQEFHDLLEHPLIDDVVPDLLGDYFLIHSYSANIARPGNEPMMVHTDQVGIQPPMRDMFYGMNIMWFLTDVTAENGKNLLGITSHSLIIPNNF
jgi:hypothetical protein